MKFEHKYSNSGDVRAGTNEKLEHFKFNVRKATEQ